MLNRFTCSAYAILAEIGGSNIKKVDAGKTTTTLNTTLTNITAAIGFIVVAIAIVKMIMALADENAKSKADSTIMLGTGIFFASASKVIESLGVNDAASLTYATVAHNILDVIGALLTYAGGALTVIAAFTLVMAVMHENADQQAKSSTLLMVAAGLLSANALTTAIKNKMFTGNDYAGTIMTIVINFIASIVTYGGGAIAVIGVFKLVSGIRTEETKERNDGIKLLMVGIALLSFRAVLMLFGI